MTANASWARSSSAAAPRSRTPPFARGWRLPPRALLVTAARLGAALCALAVLLGAPASPAPGIPLLGPFGYKALRRSGMSPADARQAVEEADSYFRGIGVGPSTPTRIPGDR
jgi:hypothetical protein